LLSLLGLARHGTATLFELQKAAIRG